MVPLSEVRQVRIVEERASQCPMVQVKLKAGEAKQFSRCNGSPFSAEVNGKLVELEVLRGRGLQVKDGRAAARAAERASAQADSDGERREVEVIVQDPFGSPCRRVAGGGRRLRLRALQCRPRRRRALA